MVSTPPKVRLDENPDRVPAELGRQVAGRGSCAALEAERYRTRARAHRTFLD